MRAFLRNLPTLSILLAEKYDDFGRATANTEAREVLQNLSKVRDPRNLLLAVGLAQLLELYTTASVLSQHYTRFPTQTWTVLRSMRTEVEQLSKGWTWSDKPLDHALCRN